ncbi:hypothetical protein ACFL6Y_01085 [Elusimicrobiota bacterium]
MVKIKKQFLRLGLFLAFTSFAVMAFHIAHHGDDYSDAAASHCCILCHNATISPAPGIALGDPEVFTEHYTFAYSQSVRKVFHFFHGDSRAPPLI